MEPVFISTTKQSLVQPGQLPVKPEVKSEIKEEDKKRPREDDVKDEPEAKVPALELGSATLVELMDAGILKPGTDTVAIGFKGTTFKASLLPGGIIEWQGQPFKDPSAFSITVKRLLSPYKDEDETAGWRSVHVDGVSLLDYRYRYHHKLLGKPLVYPEPAVEAEGGVAGEGDLPPLPSAADIKLPAPGEGDGEEAAEGEPDTANWVQCSRCQQWRVVPDEFWPDIDAAGDEDWYCNEATWDVTGYEPFTPACK